MEKKELLTRFNYPMFPQQYLEFTGEFETHITVNLNKDLPDDRYFEHHIKLLLEPSND